MAEVSITTSGKKYVDPAVKLLAPAFETDPVIRYMLCSMSEKERISYLPRYFDALITAAGMNKAIFSEANKWESTTVVMPPGSRPDNPLTILQAGFIPMLAKIGVKGCYRMMGEFVPKADAAKKKGLKGNKNYYYVFFTATRADARGKGLCSTLLKKTQELAASTGDPVWLEATTENSMKIYSKLGWELVETIIVGKGKANSEGMLCKGGEGVPVWAMVWFPTKPEP